MDPFTLTEALPQELLIVVFALANPSPNVPAVCRVAHEAASASLVQCAWRNRILLGDGSIKSDDDSFTYQLNTDNLFSIVAPQITRSHPMVLLRRRLPGAGEVPYAGCPAPASPAHEPLVCLDYVKYLFSNHGPFISRLIRDGGAAEIGPKLDRLSLESFMYLDDPEFDDEQPAGDVEQGEQVGEVLLDEPAEEIVIEPVPGPIGAIPIAEVPVENTIAFDESVQDPSAAQGTSLSEALAKFKFDLPDDGLDLQALITRALQPQIPFIWWKPIPDTFTILNYLIRTSQLESLELALTQLFLHIPDLACAQAPAIQWGMLCLDNRSETRSWFNNVYATNRKLRISFSQFLVVLALFDWSCPTLEIIIRTLDLSVPSVIDFVSSVAGAVQPAMFKLLCNISDAARVFQVLEWFDSHEAPLAHFPFCAASKNTRVFSRLLFERDLPRLALQPDPAEARLKVCAAVRDFIMFAPNEDEFISQVNAHDLIDVNVWAHFAGLCSFYGIAFRFAEVIQTKFSESMSKEIIHQAILHNLDSFAGTPNLFHLSTTYLLDVLTAFGVDLVDYVLDHIDLWNAEKLAMLLQTTPKTPWARPAAIARVLDRLVSDSSSISALDARRHVANAAMMIQAHLICDLFGLCLNVTPSQDSDPSLPAAQSLPDWLLDMTHQQLAIIFACHIRAYDTMDRGKPLNLPATAHVVHVLRGAWALRPSSDVTLSASLPLPLACSILHWARHWLGRDGYATYSMRPEDDQGFKHLVDLLIELDPDLVLIAIERDNVADAVMAKLPEVDLVAAQYSYKCYADDSMWPEVIRTQWPVEQLKAGWPAFVRLSDLRLRLEEGENEDVFRQRIELVREELGLDM